jgi:excisionase family DNA binding protein
MTPGEVAKYLGTTQVSVYELIDNGNLPAYRTTLGNDADTYLVRIRTRDVVAHMNPVKLHPGDLTSRIDALDLPEASRTELLGEIATASSSTLRKVISAAAVVVLGCLPIFGYVIERPSWIDQSRRLTLIRPMLMMGLATAIPTSLIVVAAVVLGKREWSAIRRSFGTPAIVLSLLMAFISLVFYFASVYWSLSIYRTEAFGQQLSKVDALYFSMTVFTTTGFSDIHPAESAPRAVITVQMLAGFVMISFIVALLISRALSDE